MLVYYDNCGKLTWASHIRNLLFSHGYGFIWLNQTVGNVDLFLHNFRDQAVCMYKQEWHYVLTNSSDRIPIWPLSLFFSQKKYLSFTMSRNLRSCFTRLRLGLLDIKINEGRKNAIDKCTRTCPFCDSEIETEIHLLFVCPPYHYLRTKYTPGKKLSTPQYIFSW